MSMEIRLVLIWFLMVPCIFRIFYNKLVMTLQSRGKPHFNFEMSVVRTVCLPGVRSACRVLTAQPWWSSAEGSGSQVLLGLGAPRPPCGSHDKDPHCRILSKVPAVPLAQDGATRWESLCHPVQDGGANGDQEAGSALARSFCCCVALGKSLGLSEPRNNSSLMKRGKSCQVFLVQLVVWLKTLLKGHTGGGSFTNHPAQTQGAVLASTERVLCHRLNDPIAKRFLFNWAHLSRLNNNNYREW